MNLDNKTTDYIFKKIDEIIGKSISEKPVPLKNSNFLKEYKKLKEEVKNERCDTI